MLNITLLVCLLFVGAVFSRSDLPLIKTDPISDAFAVDDLGFPSDGSGAYTIAFSEPYSAIIIMKRNTEGFYRQAATYNVTNFVSSVSTNGKWFSFVLSDQTTHVFQLDSNNQIVQKSIFTGPSRVVKLLSDDTLVFISGTNLTTYQYQSNAWTVSEISAVDLAYEAPFTFHHLTDKTLASFSPTGSVNLYRRNQDKSWTFAESFLIANISEVPYSIVWNGDDAVVLGSIELGDSGAVWLYTKQNNNWILNFKSNGLDIGVIPPGGFGYRLLALDVNTILVSAIFDGSSNANIVGGSVSVLSRQSGSSEWQWTLRIQTTSHALIGFDIFRADDNILMIECGYYTTQKDIIECKYNSLPTCFNQPADVTCKKIDTCQSMSNLEISSLYTVNDSKCGNTTVTASMISVQDKAVKISVSVERAAAPTATCEVILSCSNNDQTSKATLIAPTIFVLLLILFVFL